MTHAEHGVRGSAATDAETRTGTARIVLWLVVAALAVRQMTVVLRQPPGERLTDLETWIGENGVLRVKGSLYDPDRFTGTPSRGSS